MFNEETKAGIINNLGIVAGVKPSDATVALMTAVVEKVQEVGVAEVTAADVVAVTVEVDGKSKSLTQGQAEKVFAAIEFHNAVVARKRAERKPTKLEEYIAETPVDVRDDVAVQVAERRINAEGTKPKAWRRIREELGLRNEVFHQLIRKSDGWHTAVCERILDLLDQEGGWEYNGKLEVLTGIDNFTMDEVHAYKAEMDAEAEADAAAAAAEGDDVQ